MRGKKNKSVRQTPALSLSEVLSAIHRKYNQSLFNKAVSIFTRFPQKVALDKLKLSQEAIEFIRQYEPRANSEGLFLHQWRLFEAYTKGAKNFILTSATGSGKSMCFWAWVIDRLSKDSEANALLCFPTQALMWGQADRLRKISEKSSLVVYDNQSKNAYSGTLRFGSQKIGWTVWKGSGYDETKDKNMKTHEGTEEFCKARIRLATLDKAHWSLIRSHIEFTKNLECVVLDEAHQYDGIFGANVLYFLKRLYVAKESARRNKPNMFLASATLSDAKSFAAKLLSLNEVEIHHETDAVKPEIKVISLDEAKNLLKKPPQGGFLRVAIFIDSMEGSDDLTELLKDTNTTGNNINIIYFSNSKFESRIVKKELDSIKTQKRTLFIYDADLTPEERRRIEALFNKGIMGGTLIATSALELGVDIENLDLCLLNTIPPKRVDFIQRIGRVGRRQERPGLVILNLSAAPFDRYIAKNLDAAFHFDTSRSIPIPSDIEMLRLRHMAAAHYEGCYRNYADGCWNHYKQIFEKHFGKFHDKNEIKDILEKHYSGLLDLSGMFWVHDGFRASASQGKIPLIKIDQPKDKVALIEDINIFRDAHPGAVYLDANGRRWQIVSYSGNWKQAEWEHPDSKVVLAKYLKNINAVYVKEVKNIITTRGMWEESFEHYQLFADPPRGIEFPSHREIKYGIWEYSKKFNGYKEINLKTRGTRLVSLAEVTEQFKKAVGQKENFPFLFPLSYRTYGWLWDFRGAFKESQPQFLKEIEGLVSHILEPYVADVVQANPANLQISLSLSKGCLRILDASPGGNGLSEALLRNGCMSSVFSNCIDNLEPYTSPKMKDKFKSYILQLYREDATHEPSQVITIIKKLQSYWNR